MAQNTSSAVMQQRKEPSDSFDYFPTPLWATRALCEWLYEQGYIDRSEVVLEPACGEGHMSRALSEYFPNVLSADVQDMGYGEVRDFLFGDQPANDWVITNPPFRLAEQFLHKAQNMPGSGVALLVRTSFLESVGRYQSIYRDNAPSLVLQYSERVPMLKGRVDKKASTATSYCWLIWLVGTPGTELHWIPPCRKRLERPGDYA